MPHAEHDHRVRKRAWRIGTPLVAVMSGALFVASATNSEGTDLRPGRHLDLASLVRSESQQVEELQGQASRINNEIDNLSGLVADKQVRRVRRDVEKLAGPAGFDEVTGEGLKVVLSDAPVEVRETSEQEVNLLVVHQQDIQAVVNSMWAAGAEAIMVQGQRVISTTGIKCAGNSVELQGIPYAQPYEIVAVGDTDAMRAKIDGSAYLEAYRAQAALPDISVGWSMEGVGETTVPAYEGIRGLDYAEPIA